MKRKNTVLTIILMLVLCFTVACGKTQQSSAESSFTTDEQFEELEGTNQGEEFVEAEEFEKAEELEKAEEPAETEEPAEAEEPVGAEEPEKAEESVEAEEPEKAENPVEAEEPEKAEEPQEVQDVDTVGESQETQQMFLIWYDGSKNLKDMYWKWESDPEWNVVWENETIQPGTGAEVSGIYKEEMFMVKKVYEDGEVSEVTLSAEEVKMSKEEMGDFLVYYALESRILW